MHGRKTEEAIINWSSEKAATCVCVFLCFGFFLKTK